MAHPSPATRLPLEIVKIIISYLTYDTCSLRACTLACYSWYIAAVPHLHYTFVASICSPRKDKKLMWPESLPNKYKLGLLPLVKVFWVRVDDSNRVEFSPRLFSHYILRQFSALTNVRDLRVDRLNIPSFMPNIRRYFVHFLPTVKYLALSEPKGSRRQIIYFIGLFQQLDHLKLAYDRGGVQNEPADDLTLFPPFVPPLRGNLTLVCFRRVGLLKDMIRLFGGIRFRSMNIFHTDGMRLLLDTSAKTLKTVMLYPDPYGKQLPLKCVQVLAKDPAATYSLEDFNLSRNESLRTLIISASSVSRTLANDSPDATTFLNHVLSTVTSTAFLKVFVVYSAANFLGINTEHSDGPYLRELSQTEKTEEASRHQRRFEVLCEVHKVRDFQLVLRAAVWGGVGEYPVQMLEEAVVEEKAKGGSDGCLSNPSVKYCPQRTRTWL